MKLKTLLLSVVWMTSLQLVVSAKAETALEVRLDGQSSSAQQLEPLDQVLSDPATLDRIQYGIEVVRKTANEEELKVLSSMEQEIKAARAELSKSLSETSSETPRKQTRVGRIASRVGIAINRGLIASFRPFIYGAGYLTGRFEKRSRFKETGDHSVQNLLGRLANRLRDKGEVIAAELADQLLRGDRLTSDQIIVLVEALPALDLREWEGIASGAGYGIGIGVASQVLAVAGLGVLVDPILLVGITGVFGASIPCMGNWEDGQNENLKAYCNQITEDFIVRIYSSRIRGYLRGVRARAERASR